MMKHQTEVDYRPSTSGDSWARRKLGKLIAVALVAARSKLAYWQEMSARAVFFAIVLLIFSQLWSALLGAKGELAGFDRRQLVWYLTITEVIALSTTSLIQTVENDVKTGQLAYLLLRPINLLTSQGNVKLQRHERVRIEYDDDLLRNRLGDDAWLMLSSIDRNKLKQHEQELPVWLGSYYGQIASLDRRKVRDAVEKGQVDSDLFKGAFTKDSQEVVSITRLD